MDFKYNWSKEEIKESKALLHNTHFAIVDEDFENMLISALRYALGRQTYITSTTAIYITHFLEDFSDRALVVLKKDLEYYENRRGEGLIYDDEECDHIHWVALLNKINEELDKRGINA